MHSHKPWWLKGLFIVAMIAIAATVFGWIVTLLWNWLMTSLFGLRSIGFREGLGLFLLGKVLFGGFRGFGGPHRHRQQHQRRLHERWERMTPQERESFSRGLRHCPWGKRSKAAPDQDASNS